MINRENTKTVRDLVLNAGEEFGDKTFIRYEENETIFETSYAEFAAQCQAVAAWVREQDEVFGHKVKVGLMGSSSHHYLAVLLGVMSNGNTAIPLDIQLNLATFSDNLNRSDVDILFYDWEHRALVEGAKGLCPKVNTFISLQHGKHVPCSDNILKKYAGQTVDAEIAENDCAMILFTSGTTGRGKGVMLSNGNLIDNTFCTTDNLNPENETYLSVLPIHHVFCLNGDVFIVMRYGSTLCLNRDMTKIAVHIQLFQPSVMRMVPMVAKALYNRYVILSKQQEGTPAETIKEMVYGKRLHKIISGGGYLAPELAENYRNIGINIAQGYGMSECSPKIAAPDWSRPDKVATVGKVVDGCQVRIVDEEIQVKSPSVMMGYYKEPDKTAEAMTEDGWLRTGDIGFVDEENFLHLTGRKKNLIILSNGENVAPEQLENLFEDEWIIEDILVYGEDDTVAAEIYPNYKYIEVAGITNPEQLIADAIKKHNEELPSFKRIMKHHIREVPFEKTSSRKIIRSQYFSQKKAEEEQVSQVRKPENDTQAKIYQLAAQTMGHERFGIDTNLYEAGLDSLGSVMFLTDLYNQMDVSMTLDELMKHASILQLEAFYEESKKQEKVNYAIRDKYPLTTLQMFFAYIMRGNTTGNLPFLFRLDPSVDLKKLKACVEELFEVHPELKDIIQMDGKMYMNFRDDARVIDIPIVKLTDEQWEVQKGGLIQAYQYGQGEPLYHISIYETESANYLFFDVAHIIGDGMTMNILFEDLNAIYTGKQVKKETYTFYEYILDYKEKDAQGLRRQNEEYYEELMKGFKVHKCILNRKDKQNLAVGKDAALKARFENLSRKEITAFCRKNGVSENVLFLTAYNYCIGIFSDEQDTISTSIHSGRTDSRWNRLAGSFFLTYYFRYQNQAHETVPQLLQRCGQQIMDTMRCYISNLHADEMFFQYQGDILNINEIGGAPAERVRMQLDALPFHLQVMADPKGYYYELRYWENRFDTSQLEIFMKCLETIVGAMLVESSVRKLKNYLPEPLFPMNYYAKAEDINREARCDLFYDVTGDTRVKVYVLDSECRKKPYGGWGNLYVRDHETLGYVDKITNPYGKGVLYQTGRIARILPDGSINMLEQGGRTIMSEATMGRNFLNLQVLENVLRSFPGIRKAEAFVEYKAGDKLVLTAEISGTKKPDMDVLKGYLAEECEPELIPGEIRFVGEEV